VSVEDRHLTRFGLVRIHVWCAEQRQQQLAAKMLSEIFFGNATRETLVSIRENDPRKHAMKVHGNQCLRFSGFTK